MSVIPDNTRLGIFFARHLTNPWVLFLACAAIAALPSMTWSFRTWLLSCLALFCALLCGIPHFFFGWPGGATQRIIPDLFGIAAGVLLGLNLQMFLSPVGAVPNRKRKNDQSATNDYVEPLENLAPLALQDAVGKEQS